MICVTKNEAKLYFTMVPCPKMVIPWYIFKVDGRLFKLISNQFSSICMHVSVCSCVAVCRLEFFCNTLKSASGLCPYVCHTHMQIHTHTHLCSLEDHFPVARQ